MRGAGRLVFVGLILLLVFLIGGRQALGNALTMMAISLTVVLVLGALAVWLIRRKVRKETRRLTQMFLGGLGGNGSTRPGPQPPPPRPSDEAIDADFTVRK